ncbi:amino acid ABC transporter substrate-binding protein [Endozoicomonas sp. OPT23]|uniref:ABC transporter substrate-binding protein n=1 Tax=Endozoicomonas sp. OPT23 TaxID=2072845 RepID=UPI00129A36E5|nr:ABC transporter substrate-binding protein [Endozoicomonas sp. OPT23]MRI31768.1 amino acid ABC transporter substrate-binding protein [Endozoicomonas sp. OPT23]
MSRLFQGIVCSLTLLLSSVSFAEEVMIGADPAEADLKLGCMYPLSGSSALWGRDAVAGMELALADIAITNEKAPKITAYISDTMGKAYRSREITQQLLTNKKVDALCGVVNSAIALETSRIAKQQQILFLGAGHSTSRTTEEELHPWYFHLNNDASQSMMAGARYLKELQQFEDWKTLSYIGPDYEYGHQLWQKLTDSLDQLGVKYRIKNEFYSLHNENSYETYIKAIASNPPDILINGHWTQDLVRFVEQANNAGLLEQTRFANFDTGGGYFALSRLQDNLPDGLILSARHHINWPETEENQQFVDRFYQQNHRLPTFVAQDAYTVIIALAEAWQQTPDKNMASIRYTLEGLQLSLPEDPKGFQSWIDPLSHKIMQVQAIGVTARSKDQESLAVQLKNWKLYYPERKPLNDR